MGPHGAQETRNLGPFGRKYSRLMDHTALEVSDRPLKIQEDLFSLLTSFDNVMRGPKIRLEVTSDPSCVSLSLGSRFHSGFNVYVPLSPRHPCLTLS